MAKKYIQPGEVITFTAGANLVSGQPVVIGEMVGIVQNDVLNGAQGEAAIVGVWEVVKAAGATWTKGQKLFWDKTNLNFTPTASADADLLAGYAFEDALIGAVLGNIKLCGPATAKVIPAIAAHGAPAPVAAAQGAGYVQGDINTALDAKADSADLITVTAKLDALLAALKVAGIMDN